MNNSLLPPNSTPYLRLMEQIMAPILQIPVEIISSIWHPWKCPANMLPWLAEQLSVDSWDEDWSIDIKRDVIAASMEVHRNKGTIGAIKRFLNSAGFGDATIIEGLSGQTRDNTISRNGLYQRGDVTGWAQYKIIMQSPVPASRITSLKAALEKIAPARSELVEVNYTKGIAHEGVIYRDGTYTYGAN